MADCMMLCVLAGLCAATVWYLWPYLLGAMAIWAAFLVIGAAVTR